MNLLQEYLLKLRFNVWAKFKLNKYPSFNLSHSQFGEDTIVRFLTNDVRQGFYIDIGAHHPVYYSNTHHFYCKGWHGINIDGAPGMMDTFNVLRPRDVNLEILLSPEKTTKPVEFYIFERSALNTFDPVMAEKAICDGNKLIERKSLPTSTLVEVLDSYVPPGTDITLMSIDIEGLDESIIMSNDWQKYKPSILVFEKHDVSLKEIGKLEILNYLEKQGYQLVAKSGPSLIFQLQ